MAAEAKTASVGSVSLGVTVIALYFLFVSCVTFGFGSYIYRTTWQVEAASMTPDANGVIAPAPDIDNLLFILKREEALEAAKAKVFSQIALAKSELPVHDSRVKQSFGPIARAKSALSNELVLTMDELDEYRFSLPGNARQRYEVVANDPEIEPDPKIRSLLRIIEMAIDSKYADFDPKLRVAYPDFKLATETTFDELIRVRDEANAASLDIQAEKSVVLSRIEELESRVAKHDEVIAELQKTLPPASIARARLSTLALEIPLIPNVLMRLVSFPTIFLTLIVTIAAGGLGTVVAFSRRYYSSKKAATLTLSRLFVNVGEGIAAAIAIFLFSGAGMLALTQGGSSGNDVELSPYTVAFIAFLSGFMAEDAFASIQSAGKRIFKPDDPNGEPKPTEPTNPA
jgi:hypothetical protein